MLNRDPESVTVLEIMDILEGPIEISDCLETGACNNIDCCATRTVWIKLKDAINGVMENITLQDIVNDYHKTGSMTILEDRKGEK